MRLIIKASLGAMVVVLLFFIYSYVTSHPVDVGEFRPVGIGSSPDGSNLVSFENETLRETGSASVHEPKESVSRRLTGIVVSTKGPLDVGWITVISDRRKQMYNQELVDGGFALVLPETGFDGEQVSVHVSDGKANVFSGTISINKYVTIHVETTADRQVEGELIVVNADPAQEWFAMLTSRVGGGNVAIGTSSAHSDIESRVTWAEMDPRLANVDGPVDLTIQPFEPRVSSLGHMRFESLDAFKEALSYVIYIEAPSRIVSVDHPSFNVVSVSLVNAENMASRYYGSVDGKGTVSVGLPSGHYFVYGLNNHGDGIVGELAVEEDHDVMVDWVGRVPGQVQVEVKLSNLNGDPVSGVPISYEMLSVAGGVHSGRSTSMTNDYGVVVLSGLLPRKYTMYAIMGGAYSRVNLGVLDASENGHFSGTVPELNSIKLLIDGLDVVDYSSIDVLLSIDEGMWVGYPTWTSFSSGKLSIDSVSFAEKLKVAVRCDMFGGFASTKFKKINSVDVEMKPLRRLSVEVKGAPDDHSVGVRIMNAKKLGVIVMPWEETELGVDGSAKLYVWDAVGDPEIELFRYEDGERLGVCSRVVDGEYEYVFD